MYSLALIQNQSEMSHYGYADARPLLEEILIEMGKKDDYTTVLYTAQNIDQLNTDLKRLRFDAVIFASNALSDETIQNVVMSDKFTEGFRNFLNSGKGCLILHQIKLAGKNTEKDKSFNFLPAPFNVVAPKRDSGEKASEGNLYQTSIAENHVCFLHPNNIDIVDIKNQCLSFKSLPGLYWHYLSKINTSDWDLLVYDSSKKNEERPLIAVSKESNSFRIVVSSLTLDWQKQKKILENILIYVTEGKHSTALIRDSTTESEAFDYFIESLKSQKYPHTIYNLDKNNITESIADLERNIVSGVHTIIILDPFIEVNNVETSIDSLIRQYIKEGKIKLISIEQDNYLEKFYVAGRERYALRLLHELEVKIQTELSKGYIDDKSNGYIDGSFWNTVESLQILDEIPYVKSKFDKENIGKVLEEIEKHDQKGSYDEVFGVTCVLLWLLAKYLGVDNNRTKSTLKWIRNNLADYESREKTLAYYTLIRIYAKESDKGELRKIILSQKWDELSEIDLLVYLKAAILLELKDVFIPIVIQLNSKHNNGAWVDLATSATAANCLLDVLNILKKDDEESYDKIKLTLDKMIFKTIIYIQNFKDNISKNISLKYPWGNEANTSLKCIQAWLKFEELVELPIQEVIDTLKSYSNIETSKSSTNTTLIILEELKNENRKLIDKKYSLITEIEGGKKILKVYRNLILLFVAIFYIFSSLIVYSSLTGTNIFTKTLITGASIGSLQYHATFIALMVGIIRGMPLLKKWLRVCEK